ncbi:hypothetical protein D3C71_1290570 [compost metagenome]
MLCGRARIQVADRRARDALAERDAPLQVVHQVDAEVEVGQDVAVAVLLGERLLLIGQHHAEVIVGLPFDRLRDGDDGRRHHIGGFIAHAQAGIGAHAAQFAVQLDLEIGRPGLLLHQVVGGALRAHAQAGAIVVRCPLRDAARVAAPGGERVGVEVIEQADDVDRLQQVHQPVGHIPVDVGHAPVAQGAVILRCLDAVGGLLARVHAKLEATLVEAPLTVDAPLLDLADLGLRIDAQHLRADLARHEAWVDHAVGLGEGIGRARVPDLGAHRQAVVEDHFLHP